MAKGNRGFLQGNGKDDDLRRFDPDTVDAFACCLAERGLKAGRIKVKLAGPASLGKYGIRVKDGCGTHVLAENPWWTRFRLGAFRTRPGSNS